MLVNALKYGTGASVGIAIANSLNNKTREGEQAKNNVGTATSLAVAAATPYLLSKAAKAHPKTAVKLYGQAGTYIGKAIDFATKQYKKYGPKIFETLNTSKIGKDVLKYAGQAKDGILKYVKGNKTLSKLATTVLDKAEKFMKSSASKKGKYAIAGAVLAWAGLTAIKLIRNHDKKSGAIDQKYKDMYDEYQKNML